LAQNLLFKKLIYWEIAIGGKLEDSWDVREDFRVPKNGMSNQQFGKFVEKKNYAKWFSDKGTAPFYVSTPYWEQLINPN